MIKQLLMVIMAAAATVAAPVGQVGFIESKVSYELDTLSNSGGKFIHQERLSYGLGGDNDFMDLNYRFTLGGVLRGNSAYPLNQITPEYGVRTNLKPMSSMNLSLFSYSRLRNPMQIVSDSLEFKEFVHGLKLQTRLSSRTNFSIATGLKTQQINHRDSSVTTQQFVSLNLEQRMLGMQFRLNGETDVWSKDSLDAQKSNAASIQWYGSPMRNLRWTATNSFFQTEDYDFWRVAHRMNYDLSQRQQIWARFNQGDFAYGSQTLLRQSFDLRYRFQWRPAFGLDLMVKGNRVSVPDSIDIFHWRSYGLSTHWSAGKKGFARGNIDAGFKESYLYGQGLDFQVNATESGKLLSTRTIDVSYRDDVNTELFVRMDESDDPRYDIQHKLKMTAEYRPGSSLRFGNNLKFHNHFGSDLDFSPDTLRNAIIDEIYFKRFQQTSQFSIFYRTIYTLHDPDNDLQFNLNTRIFKQISETLSCSFMSMYRFKSTIYTDYLWLSTTLKYRTTRSSYAIEFQSAGHPDVVTQQDSRIWLRFVRQI